MTNPMVDPEPEPSPVLTLKEKLAEVAADCGYVRKDGRNEFHKYNYATAATIFERVSESLHEHRLVSKPKFRIANSTERQNSKNQTETLVTVEVTLQIADLDSDATIEFNGFGSGMDNSDKAVMKAQTAAMKYAWMMGLNISTGDDPEADEQLDSRASGKAKEKPAPRGPYKPGETMAPSWPDGAAQASHDGAPDDPSSPPQDDEPPSIFEPPSGPPMTKAELAAAAGHAVIEGGGTAKEAVVQISRELNKSLGVCPCGSPLIEKTTSEAKGSRRYKTCQLNDKAFLKDEAAMKRIRELDASGDCPADGHTWRWIK